MQNNVDRDRRCNFSPQVFTGCIPTPCINPCLQRAHTPMLAVIIRRNRKLDRRPCDRPDDDEFDFRQIAIRSGTKRCCQSASSLCRRRDRFPSLQRWPRRAQHPKADPQELLLYREILPFATEWMMKNCSMRDYAILIFFFFRLQPYL